MTRSELIEAMARAIAGTAYEGVYFTTRSREQYVDQEWKQHQTDATTSLSAIEQAGLDLTPWAEITTAPEGDQIMVWETDYGWLLACKDRHQTTGWSIKSSGNFWAKMPTSVVANLTHWRPVGSPPLQSGRLK